MSGRGASVRFVAIFTAMSGVLLSLYYFPYAEGSNVKAWLDGYLRGYAAVAGALLRVFDPSIRVAGQTITGRFAMRIVKTCDAMDVLILLVSAITAWPASGRARARAAVLGALALSALNVVRICSIYYVGVYAPGAVDLVHLELWPALILVAAVGGFLAFVFQTAPEQGARGPGGPS